MYLVHILDNLSTYNIHTSIHMHVSRLERERIRTWATKESQQETSSTLSSTKTSSSSVAGLKTTTLPIRKSPLR